MTKRETTENRTAKRTTAPGVRESADGNRERDDRQADARREHIATAAYYRAERRNFEGNGELDDWLEAEREIDGAAAAGGIQSEASRLAEGPSDISASAIREPVNAANDPDLIDPSKVHQWAENLGVSPVTLRLAIERVGARVPDVKRFLEQHEQLGAPSGGR